MTTHHQVDAGNLCAQNMTPYTAPGYLSYPPIHPDTEKQQQGHRKNQPDDVRLEAPLLCWCSHVGLKTILLLDSILVALLRSLPQPWNRFGFWNSHRFSNCSSATYGISLAKAEVSNHKATQHTQVPKPYYHIQACSFVHYHRNCPIYHQHFQRSLYLHSLQSQISLLCGDFLFHL
jgi:hypothetical protein